MSRVVLVVGTGRSGTSAVAGVLDKLGVHMGDEFTKTSPSNKYGTYEEREFFDFNRKIQKSTDVDGWIRDYIARRSDGHVLWGLKDPMLARVFYIVASYLDDVKVIVTRRNKIPTVSSYMLAYHAKANDAENWYNEENAHLRAALEEYNGSVLYVDYDDLVEYPERELKRITDYVFDGMPFDHHGNADALSHIKTDGRKFDRDGKWLVKPSEPKRGWGNVAVGARIGKYPEYHFFTSWTSLINGGLRSEDKILMPIGWLTAHNASNALTREFLRTDLDSLFLVDDDMAFDAQDLERLRSNEANWDYDVVFGFCTHRVWPPKPVVMRRKEQPGLPYSLLGEAFVYPYDEIVDGAVVDVDVVGLAFTLIKRHVLEAMTEEYGPMYSFYFSYGPGLESDDVPFSRRARELGFKMGVDTSVKIGHIGQTIFGWPDYQQWMWEHSRPNVVEFNNSDFIPILQEALPHLKENKVAAENVLKWIGGA